MITKPMLAGPAPADLSQLQFPLLATPKLDGIRCLMINGKAVSRRFKPIPNDYIRQTLEMTCNSMTLDGEILVRNRTFNELSGDVRRMEGRPDFYYAVFDVITPFGIYKPYVDRMSDLKEVSLPPCCTKILPAAVKDRRELLAFEQKCLTEGYEGVMVRTPGSPYKCGRSSTDEGYLLKIKRFEDAEALIYGVEEMMHNDNVAMRDAFGRTERSTHKENMRPAGVLGALLCRLPNGIEFDIGTGFTLQDRQTYWAGRKSLIGKTVKFKHQPSGAKEKPRFPSFIAFREEYDMSK